MSTTTQEVDPAPTARRRPAHRRGGLLGDVLVAVVWFVVAGAVGAIAWRLLVHLPNATRVEGGVALTPDQLVRQVSLDGWYFVVAAVLGVLSGVSLTLWRRRDPLLTVVLVALGAGLAAYLMVRLGLVLGPDSPESVLRSRASGATAPVQLKIAAPGIAWVWPIAASLGALGVLWGTPNPDEPRA
jgi:hypothetical protein